MKTKEIFEKVYIESESDLPKEKGNYMFGWSRTDIELNFGITRERFDPSDDAETLAELCESYDWYLQPVETKEGKTAEKYLQKP